MAEDKKPKKINKWVFMLLATLFNVLLMVVIFLILFVAMTALSAKIPFMQEYITYFMLAALIITFVLAFVLYKKILTWAMKKWNLEEAMSNKR